MYRPVLCRTEVILLDIRNNIHPEASGQIISYDPYGMKVHSYHCYICEIRVIRVVSGLLSYKFNSEIDCDLS